MCVCERGGESHKQTNKQKYIQEGIFFLAEAPEPSALGGSLRGCMVLGAQQLLMETTHSGTSVL